MVDCVTLALPLLDGSRSTCRDRRLAIASACALLHTTLVRAM